MDPSEETDAKAPAASEPARRHPVCYEIWPAFALVQGQRVQVGFELDLCGACADSFAAGTAGEGPGVATFEELEEIAKAILPAESGDAAFEIEPYDNSVHESPRRGYRPEVVLALRISHKRDVDRPVDEGEERCRREIEVRLRQLGIPRA